MDPLYTRVFNRWPWDRNEMLTIQRWESPIAKELGEATHKNYRNYVETASYIAPYPENLPTYKWSYLGSN